MMPANADSTRKTLEKAFIIALLLSGSSNDAEACVVDAYVAEDVDRNLLSPFRTQRLLQSVIQRTLERAASCNAIALHQDSLFAVLPWQVGSIFTLPLLQRRCFVLRVLAGLSREICGQILDITAKEVGENTRFAFEQLTMRRDATVVLDANAAIRR